MSGEEGPVTWLRAQVEARKALARGASGLTDGHWWRRMADAGYLDDGPLEPVGQLWAGEPFLDADGDVCGGEDIVVYDEGRPSDVQFDHIAANDPQDTIARCEAELAVLDEHRLVVADRGLPEQGQSRGSGYRVVWDNPTAEQIQNANMMWRNVDCPTCRVRFPCRTVRLLASGYKHRPGYREEDWKQP